MSEIGHDPRLEALPADEPTTRALVKEHGPELSGRCRALLVPSLMAMFGRRNWWAPKPLRRFHRRYGLHEGAAPSGSV